MRTTVILRWLGIAVIVAVVALTIAILPWVFEEVRKRRKKR